jgi:hypothetical protein
VITPYLISSRHFVGLQANITSVSRSKMTVTAGKPTKTDDTLITLATIQPSTKSLNPYPKTLKYFPLRRTAKLFAITDAIMASMLLVARFFITTRIVTFPIFQIAATTFYLLISCFGIFQIFSVRIVSSFV